MSEKTKEKKLMGSPVRRLTESALMLAVATLLSLITIINMPFGGSVTPLAMLPIFLIAYRYGTLWGIGVGFTYGLIQMLLGLNNLSYATSAMAGACIVLFDYLVAFGVLGMGGLFRKRLGNRSLEFALGVTVGCVLRFLCHFLTGITVWAGYAEDQAVWLYSLLYNGSYMLPELILTLIVGVILCGIFDFTNPDMRKIKKA